MYYISTFLPYRLLSVKGIWWHCPKKNAQRAKGLWTTREKERARARERQIEYEISGEGREWI